MPKDDDFDLASDLDSLSLDDFSLDEDVSLSDDESLPSGVWVKSAPEDLEEAPGISPSGASKDDDFGTDSLSTEELDKIGSDFAFVEAPMEGEAVEEDFLPDFGTEEPEALPSSEDSDHSFDEISLDDFVTFDDSVDPSGGIDDSGTSDSEIPSEADSKEEYLDIDINIEDEVDDRELEIIEGAPMAKTTFQTEEISGAEEIDLSEFTDVTFDDAPSSGAAESFAGLEVEDMNLPEMEEVSSGTEGLESLPELNMQDLDLGESGMDEFTLEEFTEPGAPESSEEPLLEEDTGVFEEGTLDGDEGENEPFYELGQEADFSDDFETVLSQEKEQVFDVAVEPSEPDMDKIHALEADLTKGIREIPQDVRGAEAILLKIEQELMSIKSEISSLKNQVSELKTAPEPGSAGENDGAKGFFADDEDETIALTGDELDNILSSAEVTEEELIATDPEGNVLEEAPGTGFQEIDLAAEEPMPEFAGENETQSDVDLFSGTVLEEALEDEIHVPDTELVPPLTTGVELDLEPLEENATQNVLTTPDLDLAPEDLSLDTADEITDFSFDVDEESEIDADGDSTLEIPLDEEMMDGVDEPSFESSLEPSFESSDELTLVEETAAPEEEAFETESIPDIFLDQSEDFPMETPSMEAAVPAEVATAPEVPAPVPQEKPVLSETLKSEIKTVLSYMDKLLESLPDEKIKEFADSEHFEVYRKLFEELGLTD